VLSRAGVEVEVVGKVSQGHPEILHGIENGRVQLVLNTPFGSGTRGDGYEIRQAAVTNGVPVITTLAGDPGRGPRHPGAAARPARGPYVAGVPGGAEGTRGRTRGGAA
jgi:hypothetical protein